MTNAGEEPVDPDLMYRLTEQLAFRGPDYLNIWVGDCVAMGHAAFHTTREAAAVRQPLSLDGHSWLNAYARIDGRNKPFGNHRRPGKDQVARPG